MYNPETVRSVKLWIEMLKKDYPALVGNIDPLESGIDEIEKRIKYLEERLKGEKK